ncbi:TVP38/TMEM64 family protein [Fredinandcohnia humi]
MQDWLVELLTDYEELSIVISILISILVSIFGFLPSVFITAANLLVFGIWKGTFLSFIGEVLGAIIAFLLYRKGFKKLAHKKPITNRLINGLLAAKGKDAFVLILSLRLLPFIPSGVVTFTAAVGEVSILIFILASTIGKIPALLLEAYSVYHVTSITTEGKIIVTIVSLVGIVYLLGKLITKNRKRDR